MERTKWTDDMLDQRFASMDEKSDLLFEELRLLRNEMRDEFAAVREEMRLGFACVREEMAAMRTELRTEIAATRAETIAFHRQVLYVVVTLWVGLLGVFATQL